MKEQRKEVALEVSVMSALPTQMAYAFLATWFGMELVTTQSLGLRLECIIGITVCLWLIHCRRAILCVCREDDMVVTVAGRTFVELWRKGIGRHAYMTIPYESVAGVSARWQELFLINVHGGLTVVPVDWNELRVMDREYILKCLREAKNEASDTTDKKRNRM